MSDKIIAAINLPSEKMNWMYFSQQEKILVYFFTEKYRLFLYEINQYYYALQSVYVIL